MIDPNLIIAAGTAFATALGAIGTFLIVIFVKIKSYHQLVNSRMDELLRLTRIAAKAEGVLEGKAAHQPPPEV